MRDETDMLRLRLEELEGSVFKHILVEADRDFHGRPKPLYYAENKEQFSRWNDRSALVRY